jgi:hypothetical protein
MSAPPPIRKDCDAFEGLVELFKGAGDDDSGGAVDAFLIQIKTLGTALLYEARAGSVHLHQASLGPDGDDEMFFRVGNYGIDALSARAAYRDGVLLLTDRWADDLRLSLEVDAQFDDVEEWPELGT